MSVAIVCSVILDSLSVYRCICGSWYFFCPCYYMCSDFGLCIRVLVCLWMGYKSIVVWFCRIMRNIWFHVNLSPKYSCFWLQQTLTYGLFLCFSIQKDLWVLWHNFFCKELFVFNIPIKCIFNHVVCLSVMFVVCLLSYCRLIYTYLTFIIFNI